MTKYRLVVNVWLKEGDDYDDPNYALQVIEDLERHIKEHPAVEDTQPDVLYDDEKEETMYEW